jgi:hypothetical protein
LPTTPQKSQKDIAVSLSTRTEKQEKELSKMDGVRENTVM